MEKIRGAYSCLSSVLLVLWLVSGGFVWSGNYPLVSIVIGMLAANVSWLFLIAGSWIDKRWIFWSFRINPDNPDSREVPLLSMFSTDALVSCILLMFSRVASNVFDGLCLLMIITNIAAINYAFARVAGLYIYLAWSCRGDGRREETADDGRMMEKLLMVCKTYKSAGAARTIITLISLIALIYMASANIYVFSGEFVLLSLFVVWINFILFVISAGRDYVLDKMLIISLNARSVDENHEMKKVLLAQLSPKIFSLLLLPLCYALISVLIYRLLG